MSEMTTHWGRWWRRVFPGRNPMVRPWDRIEAALLVCTALGAVLAFPIAASLGSDAYARQVAIANEQRATRHPATAVLLADAPVVSTRLDGTPAHGDALVPARWPVGGEQREGMIVVERGAVAGAQVPIWLNDRGDPVEAPLNTTDASAFGVGLAVAVWLGTVTTLVALYWLGVAILDKIRDGAWEREWRRVGSEWTSH
ncbi:Rv1733c family protein [Amycolatopsis anabasis]|uniref:Rv1733c family protein n=1 Tax=Amycolatopsis anabasis TaxID=1840409 RepID=UPI00131E2F40|nr:hypothetical protein [Amycolatopsis anabasis]